MKITAVRYSAKVSLPNYESAGMELEYSLEKDTHKKAYEDFMLKAKEFSSNIGAKSDSRFLQ